MFKEFDNCLKETEQYPLIAERTEIFQINLGKLCNQMCNHCHVEAGPHRTEIMNREILELCLEILKQNKIPVIDLTGGSPEMNPNFKWFVAECSKEKFNLKVRTNLTVMLEPSYEDIPQFLKDHNVEIVASLPCYTMENVDKQRGKGVFNKSIKVLKILNYIGYGERGTNLVLNLVYNPGGTFLPGDQKSLECGYRNKLNEEFGIKFNNLYTITNMPIGRFKQFLLETGEYNKYVNLLINSFNPYAAINVMCKETLSIGWDGTIYDCDFNQMLNLPCNHGVPNYIKDYDHKLMNQRRIVTGIHCYGCTAGYGSSCTGTLIDEN